MRTVADLIADAEQIALEFETHLNARADVNSLLQLALAARRTWLLFDHIESSAQKKADACCGVQA